MPLRLREDFQNGAVLGLMFVETTDCTDDHLVNIIL